MTHSVVSDGVDDVTAALYNEHSTALDTLEASPKYILFGGMNNSSPADSQTYFFGQPTNQTIATCGMTTQGQARIYVPSSGIITRVDLTIRVGTTLGTNEAVGFYLRLNATTDTTITSVGDFSAAVSYIHKTGLSIAVSAGDFLEFFMQTPAWATNPTAIFLYAQIWVE